MYTQSQEELLKYLPCWVEELKTWPENTLKLDQVIVNLSLLFKDARCLKRKWFSVFSDLFGDASTKILWAESINLLRFEITLQFNPNYELLKDAFTV